MASSFAAIKEDVFARQQRKQHYQSYILGLNAYDRHKQLMNDYAKAPQETRQPKLPIKTDEDTLRETYRFIRNEDDDLEDNWEQRLAQRYYDKLFKEYCIADMSRYKENKVGLRWRTEKEVVSGKGQFVCGNKDCSTKEELCSYEVNFLYKEAGEKKQALVKLRACPRCAHKLNYKKDKEEKRQLKRELKKRKRRRSSEDSGDVSKAVDEQRDEEQERAGGSSLSEAEENDRDDPYFRGLFP